MTVEQVFKGRLTMQFNLFVMKITYNLATERQNECSIWRKFRDYLNKLILTDAQFSSKSAEEPVVKNPIGFPMVMEGLSDNKISPLT